jgi:hypothetical protein
VQDWEDFRGKGDDNEEHQDPKDDIKDHGGYEGLEFDVYWEFVEVLIEI